MKGRCVEKENIFRKRLMGSNERFKLRKHASYRKRVRPMRAAVDILTVIAPLNPNVALEHKTNYYDFSGGPQTAQGDVAVRMQKNTHIRLKGKRDLIFYLPKKVMQR